MYEFNDPNYKKASDMIPGTQYVLLNISFPCNLYGVDCQKIRVLNKNMHYSKEIEIKKDYTVFSCVRLVVLRHLNFRDK